MEKLERVVRKTQVIESYMLELEGLFDGIKEILPEGFKMLEIEKFDGRGNLKNHIWMCM